MRITVSGHRPSRLQGKEAEIREWIRETLTEFGVDNIEEAYVGMAQGVDLIFAEECMNFGIPVICCYPCRKAGFSLEETEIMNKAKEVMFIREKRDSKDRCYLERDQYMVDHSDVVLIIWDGVKKGGTYFTQQYARRVGTKAIFCDLLQDIDEEDDE